MSNNINNVQPYLTDKMQAKVNEILNKISKYLTVK